MTALTPETWLDNPTHHAWLEHRFSDLLTFALPSIRPEGGFHYLGGDRRPMADKPPMLFLTARMAWVSSGGVREGIPGAGRLLDHAMDSLLGFHWDAEHRGWLTQPGTVTRKSTYDHVHCGMAASGAMAADHPRAAELMERVVEVIDTRLWDDATQTLLESFAPDWSDSEDYRGANANMHGTEAMILMGAATGDRVWHDRAYAVAQRLIDGFARAEGWLLPEHFAADWRPDLGYNRDRPNDPFRPYGATFGHSLEWARFLLQLDRSPWVGGQPWLLEAAEALSRRALDGGWGIDGIEGIPYTVDWDGSVVADVRLHWPVCEGIQASAELVRATGDDHWEQWYRRLWDHAAAVWIDEHGAWINEVDASMVEAGSVWPGRPDVYHAAGAVRAATLAGKHPLR
jgi:mannose/cellobiose epimerase-like protein (N-acyl-D-glucosamine 2-epimerase family)